MTETTGDRVLEAVSVAVRRGDTLLLVKRGRAPALGLYAFPGGRVEPDEALDDAARRELREETGMEAGGLALLETRVLVAESEDAPSFHLSVVLCDDAGGEPLAADDAADARFFGLAELAALPITQSTLLVARALLESGEEAGA